jgi:hypothetical protein
MPKVKKDGPGDTEIERLSAIAYLNHESQGHTYPPM